MVQYAEYFSPIGTLLLAAEEDALPGLRMARPLPPECIPAGEHPVLKAAARWLDAYFMGQNPAIAISLRPYGTAFQRLLHHRRGQRARACQRPACYRPKAAQDG